MRGVPNYRQILLWALRLRRLEMARESQKCPPGSEPLNPPTWIPPIQQPPGTEIPDGELPPGQEEPPPEQEEPPHEGEELSDGNSERTNDSDEVVEEVVLGGESLSLLSEEEDLITEDVVEALPPSPNLVNEFSLSLARETDSVVEDVVTAPPVHVPEIVERGSLDRTLETDLISEQVMVAGPPPDPDLPPPPEPEFWHRTLANQTYQGDIVVPDGERWLIGAGVRLQGNLRTTGGTIGMRPGSSLTFIGADPDLYVGGGLTYAPEFANDFGIWIGHDGVLDIRGTPKVGWNRTGVDPTWAADDEYWITPTSLGDFKPRRWFPGDLIPRVSPLVPPAEVVNVTRDVTITGPAHIHIHSHKPQRIEYCRFEAMGVARPSSEGSVIGRYVLHFHHGFDGVRGTEVKGTAAVNSWGITYVPHLSNGIKFIDCVAVNIKDFGMWWDPDSKSDDIFIDRMLITGVETPPEIGGGVIGDTDAYTLGAGINPVIQNSVAAGVAGDKLAVGFDWFQPNADDPNAPFFVWDFSLGNVCHNCRGPGARFSTNLQDEHHVQNYRSYRNGGSMSENGAYISATRYTDCVGFEEGFLIGNDHSYEIAGFIAWANATSQAGIYDSTITSREGPAIWVTNRQLPAESFFLIENCTLIPAAGKPKVFVGPGVQETNPWMARFKNSGVLPTDIVFASSVKNVGSLIYIDVDGDGNDEWLVEYQLGAAGNRKVTAL